ncbi:MAG: GNAT family N-acetyltransferase [Bacteriovoracaceae bacterium]|nr:GNAT family N-acetyltransferase [Bacteriovoracaceae bacterium]
MKTKARYIHTTLKKRPELRDETIELIEECFGYQQPYSYEVDFLHLMNKKNMNQCFIVYDSKEQKVVSHAGVNLRLIGNSDFQIQSALMGGMATHPDYQGQGHFKSLFENVLHHYENKVSLFILWSNLDKLYAKFGFHEAGGQLETGKLPFNESQLNINFKKTKFSKLDYKNFKLIRDIYELDTSREYTTIMRSNIDWENIKNINSTDLYLCYNKNGNFDGYFCVGKGFDLQGIIHETGFYPEVRNQYFEKLAKYKMWLPQKNTWKPDNGYLLYLALFRPGNTSLFKNMVAAWSKNDILINKYDGNIVSYNHLGEPLIDTMEEFLKKLFGPEPFFEGFNYGPPLFFSGLDSV